MGFFHAIFKITLDCVTINVVMIMKWNLDELFTNTEPFYEEIEYIKKLILNIKKHESVVPDAFLLEQILTLKWKIKERTNTILV